MKNNREWVSWSIISYYEERKYTKACEMNLKLEHGRQVNEKLWAQQETKGKNQNEQTKNPQQHTKGKKGADQWYRTLKHFVLPTFNFKKILVAL